MESTLLTARPVRCPKCRTLMEGDVSAAGIGSEVCPSCRSSLVVRRFAALAVSPESRIDRPETASIGDASCYFHPEKKAVTPCQQCGRFICSLCDLPFGSRHLCPACVEGGLTSEKVPEMVSQRLVWANIALGLGWLPLLLGFALFLGYFVSGPAAIFAGIYSFKKPGSLVRGKRPVAAIFGIIGGLIQIAVLGLVGYSFSNRFR